MHIGTIFKIDIKYQNTEYTFVRFARSNKSIDFQSLDGKPVDIFFLLVGTEAQVGLHIKLLSRISRLMNRDGFREKLTSASTPEEIRKLFCDEENHFFEIT